jgi:DNA-binding NarL/FixJ family response regulator
MTPAERLHYEHAITAVGDQPGPGGFPSTWAEEESTLPLKQIIPTIRARVEALGIHSGTLPTSQHPQPALFTRSSPPRATSKNPFSAREREVFRLMAEGCSNKEIAAALVIAESTAKFHVLSILHKLGATTRAQAVALAAQRGLL